MTKKPVKIKGKKIRIITEYKWNPYTDEVIKIGEQIVIHK